MFTYIIQCNTRVFHRQLPLFFFPRRRGNYVFLQPSLSLPLLHGTRHRATFFSTNIVTAFRGTASTLLPELFPLPSSPHLLPLLFSPLCSFPFRSISVYPPRFSPSSPPLPLLTTCYNIAASGVTPVIRDGPDEAFIILSKRVSLSDPTTHRYNTK